MRARSVCCYRGANYAIPFDFSLGANNLNADTEGDIFIAEALKVNTMITTVE
jgi:hypothetical protein